MPPEDIEVLIAGGTGLDLGLGFAFFAGIFFIGFFAIFFIAGFFFGGAFLAGFFFAAAMSRGLASSSIRLSKWLIECPSFVDSLAGFWFVCEDSSVKLNALDHLLSFRPVQYSFRT